jgi:Rad3-related DNA helicase
MMRAFTRKVSLTLRRGKYRTHPLVEVLNQYFKNNHIFGGEINTPKSYASKVAVTSATETGNDAVIFTNYNRLDYAHRKRRLPLAIP